jgi:hypothetical protein
MPNSDMVFGKIDAIYQRIQKYANEPEFSRHVKSRERLPDYELRDNDVLRTMIEVIAFGQAVPAARVRAMVDRGVLDDIFGSFDPATIARMDPDELYKKHWSNKLSGIRFPDKIQKMVACAASMQAIAKRHGSFMQSTRASKLPERISTEADIKRFWDAFEIACAEAPPFFQKNFTSMCHLLQGLRFPCAKPDKIVMTVAAEIGIVPSRKQHPQRELRHVVEVIQSYAATREVSVPLVDLIFLIHGAQTEMKPLVRSSYYR